MINAQSARSSTLQNRKNTLDLELAKVEGAINAAVAKGLMFTTAIIMLEETRETLDKLGYEVTRLPDDPRDTRGAFLHKISWKAKP